MAKKQSVIDFFQQFPDNDACLSHLMVTRFGEVLNCPKCGKNGKFHRRKNRPVYECQWCGHSLSPMVGTPFEGSSTPLIKWFYAMYLFTTSRHGVPAKELQRQLGVTYKCAWRMGHAIRKYMAKMNDNGPLSGHVEIDETYIGGKDRMVGRPGPGSKKTAVMGMVERGGGLRTQVVPDTKSKTLLPLVCGNVAPGSIISTDEMRSYKNLQALGYQHGYVIHSIKQWRKGIHHTNSIEGFWSRLKNAIRGTHIHVSRQHLPNYLGEFAYRYNLRKSPEQMLDRLLRGF